MGIQSPFAYAALGLWMQGLWVRKYWFRNAILGAREMQKGAHERPSYLQFIKVLHANKFFVVCRNLACDCANLKVVVANFSYRCDLCGGAG